MILGHTLRVLERRSEACANYTPIRKAGEAITTFLELESAGGLLLVATTILALIFSNSPLQQAYDDVLKIPVEIRFGSFLIAKPLLLWINDGLMAAFFLLGKR
ncbi:Na(+)/H(+) antiporter NhaA [Caballeronia arvi]|uniref:Na(+)/H(+) antiporter NhaA n=1 Tax=Caballeronia arvi TaxID=1777135 RepID=A0A158L5G8_9BURK|nr:Na+/H+ antiporter NhaA [Caballeronia arvi]SAL88522.1 Na(+)/H(+) antiporter NhaA [Caballeronia arvi]